MRMHEIQDDWWIPDYDDGAFDLERELYELREWWCGKRQVTKQLELPFEHEEIPYAPF